MKIEQEVGGDKIFLTFERRDWNFEWEEFLIELKKLPDCKYKNKVWELNVMYQDQVNNLIQKHLTDPLEKQNLILNLGV